MIRNKIKKAGRFVFNKTKRLAPVRAITLIKKYRRFALIVSLILGFLFLILTLNSLPSPKQLSSAPAPASSQIYDRNGVLLYEIYGDENRIPVKLEELPQSLIDATLAIEDKSFYQHHGFDLKGISRALINTLLRKKLQGGSTITQQLVKNALLTSQRTITRKAKEAVLTVVTELIYSKDQILEMYFNQIPYGGISYGVEAAARAFFSKSVKDLTLAESALLAGLPAATTSYSPFAHPDRAKARQETVLSLMLELDKISPEQFQQAKDEQINFADPGSKIIAPHFVFFVREKLLESYGNTLTTQGGLKVTTSLDSSIQQTAQEIVSQEVEKLKSAKVGNGAALITNPKTGEILAMVGSKNYFADDIDGEFNVTTASRQPGSAIKPINYAIGLESKRVTPATVFADVGSCFTGGPQVYCPQNYDSLFHGPVQLRYALGNSFNIPAVRMLALNGIENFIQTASAMGLESLGQRPASDFGLSLTLGGGEVKMTEMATAFGTLANLGTKQNLNPILKIEDRRGQILEEYQPRTGTRIISKESAFLISNILSDDNARSAAFGSSSLLKIKDHPEVAVKTGTTNDKRDNWCIGYTPSLVVAVWVGNNDNTPMGWVASGITGATPIWNKITSSILEDKTPEWPSKPSRIIGTSVCNLTGAPAPEGGCELRYEFFISGSVPESRSLTQEILIDKDSGRPVQPGENKSNVELQAHPAVIDPLGTIICFDCPANEQPVKVASFGYEQKINDQQAD
ncbi:MAG: PBP1A family penicillin-binding protein [Patescibacteria group bacterium]